MPVGGWYPGCGLATSPCGGFSGVPKAFPPSAIDTDPETGVSAAATTDFMPGRVRFALTTAGGGDTTGGAGGAAFVVATGSVGIVGATGSSAGSVAGFGITTGWLGITTGLLGVTTGWLGVTTGWLGAGEAFGSGSGGSDGSGGNGECRDSVRPGSVVSAVFCRQSWRPRFARLTAAAAAATAA